MAIYEVEAAGKTFEIEAPNIKRAESAARLYVARSRMTEGATAGAVARSEIPSKPMPSDPAFYGDPNSVEAIREASRFSADVASAGPQLQMLGAGAGVGAAGGVLPFARGAALSVAGGFAGKKAAEAVGAPGWVGATAGALATPVYGPKLVMGMLSGKAGLLTGLLQRIVPAAEQKAATVAAKGLSGPEAAKAVEVKLAQLAEKRTAREAAQKLAERRIAVAEERNQLLRQRLEGKALPAPKPAPAAPPVASPDATMPATPAAAVAPSRPAPVAASAPGPPSAAELQAIVLKIQQTATSWPSGRWSRLGSTSSRRKWPRKSG